MSPPKGFNCHPVGRKPRAVLARGDSGSRWSGGRQRRYPDWALGHCLSSQETIVACALG